MSGLRDFVQRIFRVDPTNPIASPPSPAPIDEDELLDRIRDHLRDGQRPDMLVDPAYWDRAVKLFCLMATHELRRAWDLAHDPEQARYHLRLSIRATDSARRAERRARELRAVASTSSVWAGHP